MMARISDMPVAENTQETQPENRVHYPALDGIRALALAMVFLDHYDNLPVMGVGVNVFFVLSGFLITGILWDTRDNVHRVRNFYVRRALRIFPLYYGMFLLFWLLTPVWHVQWNSAWVLWPSYLGNLLMYMHPWLPEPVWSQTAVGQLHLTPGIFFRLGHLWSLCVEEQFYLVWPLIIFRCSRRQILWICSSVCVLLPFARVVASHHFVDFFAANGFFRTLPFQMDSLLLGALLAMLWRSRFRRHLLTWSPALLSIFLPIALFVLYWHVQLDLSWLPQPHAVPLPFLTWQLSLVNLLTGVLILAALRAGTWAYLVFSLPALRWIGRISYGAYIFHDIPANWYIGLAAVTRLPHPLLVTNAIAICATLVISALSFRLLESPFLRLKNRWA